MGSNIYKPRYFDVGVNLTDSMFTGVYHSKKHHKNDIMEILIKSKKLNVNKLLLTGSSLKDSKNLIEFVKKFDSDNIDSMNIYPVLKTTVGIHPCNVLEFEKSNQTDDAKNTESFEVNPDDHIENLRKIITAGVDLNIVKAFGEIGLDYDRLHFASKEKQLIYFEKQLELACEFNLPLFLHMRNACDDFIKVLVPFLNKHDDTHSDHLKLKNNNILIHSFTGDLTELNNLLNLDDNISISINGCGLKDELNCNVVKNIPLNKLMIETDSPWCEIKKTHYSYKFLLKSPNIFYPIDYRLSDEVLELTKSTKKKTPKLALNDFLPIPIVKSDKFDKFSYLDKFEYSPLIKSRNEPCLIGFVAQVISNLKQIDPEILIESCYQNSEAFFS